jgi:hypothetical protein
MPAAASGGDPRGAADHADPDHDRGPALGDRHRRHGPAGALQRARQIGPRGGSRRRYRRAAARQDRHDHDRRPPGERVPPAAGVSIDSLASAALLASLADETPEGRSVVTLAASKYGRRDARAARGAEIIPFTAQTRISGVRTGGQPDPEGRGRRGAARQSRRRQHRLPRPSCARSPTRSRARARLRSRWRRTGGCSG